MRTLKFDGKDIIRIIDAPEPVPGPGEVVVQAAVSAICGSEMHGYHDAGVPYGNNGHEGAGTVVRLGEGVANLKVGQRVGASAVAGCGDCPYCAKGQYTWCANLKFYPNMHSEFYLAAARACYPLPDDVPWDAGVLLTGDGLGVPYHTSLKIASPNIKTVAVFGVGPIGLGNVLMQSYLGRRVIAIDISDTRLEMAKRLGAESVVNAKEGDPSDRVRAWSGGEGTDVCIEAAGRPETALACFAAACKGGTVVFNGEQPALPLSPSDHFIRRDITAIGAWFYHFSEIGPMLDLYRKGLRVADLISHRYSFTEAPTAYQAFVAGQTGKVVLEYPAKNA